MTNPWLKKNPFMSMWLSAFNTAANTARGYAISQSRQKAATVSTQATKAFVDAMFGVSPKPRPRKRKKRR